MFIMEITSWKDCRSALFILVEKLAKKEISLGRKAHKKHKSEQCFFL